MPVDSLPGNERKEIPECQVGDYLRVSPESLELNADDDDGGMAEWDGPDGKVWQFELKQLPDIADHGREDGAEVGSNFVWVRRI